jgi:hypothetical protein
MLRYLELGARKRWVVTGKVHHGGFGKPTATTDDAMTEERIANISTPTAMPTL